jgi:PAS domain S-box-containing protein
VTDIKHDKKILESLIKSAHAFIESSDFKQSVRTVYDCCKNLIGATAGYVALLSADKSRNELLFLDMGDLLCDLDPDLPMPIRGLRAEAYSSGKAVYENNFQQSEWLHYLPDGHGRLDNVLFTPLALDNNIVGLFGFANKPGGFSEEDVLVSRAFAEQAAIGLMQNRTLENLNTNVNHLNTLMQTALDAIITVNGHGIIFFWNRAAENLFGYSAEEVVGKPCTCIVPEKYVEAHRQGFARFAQTGVSKLGGHLVEVEGLKKNGDTVPVELSISKWEIDDTTFFTGIIRDISQRKQMEETIKTSEKRMREIFQMMEGSGGVYRALDDGEDFVIQEFHRAAEPGNATGGHENLIGKRFLDVFPAGREYGLFEVFQRVWKTGKPEYHPVIIHDEKGIRSWRKNYIYKLSSGEIVALYKDIIERKRMEATLLESENLFRTIFETTPDPINLNRLDDGKFILVNRKFLELTGFEKNEVIGRTALDIGIWNDLAKRDQFFKQLLDEKQINDFEAEFRCKNGKILTTLVSAKLLSYNNTPHLLAVTKDITELKHAELALIDAHTKLEKKYEISTERLKESEIKYGALVEALLTGVYMCEGEDIVFVNNQFAEMFGYSKDELLNMNMMNLIHPDDRKDFMTFCEISDPMEATEGEYEIRGIRKKGDIIYLSGRNTLIEFNGKRGILGNVSNITKRKMVEHDLLRSEENMRQLSAQLLSAEERERKRIASDIHDSIGQALSAIKFSVENSLSAISEESLPAAVEALENIIPLTRQTIEEVRRIIMDLRPSMLDDLGLISTISWFCREFESIYSHILIEREVDIDEAAIPPSLKTVIYRILQEAVNNAAKHSETDFIRLHLLMNRDSLELLVEDTGIGFDIATLQSSGLGNNRGMGLPSMKERAQLSGGTFSILSRPEKGTRIHVSWPREAFAQLKPDRGHA